MWRSEGDEEFYRAGQRLVRPRRRKEKEEGKEDGEGARAKWMEEAKTDRREPGRTRRVKEE